MCKARCYVFAGPMRSTGCWLPFRFPDARFLQIGPPAHWSGTYHCYIEALHLQLRGILLMVSFVCRFGKFGLPPPQRKPAQSFDKHSSSAIIYKFKVSTTFSQISSWQRKTTVGFAQAGTGSQQRQTTGPDKRASPPENMSRCGWRWSRWHRAWRSVEKPRSRFAMTTIEAMVGKMTWATTRNKHNWICAKRPWGRPRHIVSQN